MSYAASSNCCAIPHDEFLALVGKLREATEAVLVLCRSISGNDKQPETAESKVSHEKPSGEYRRYHLPAHTVREERDLLERCDSASFADALDSIYTELHVTAFLMKGYGSDCDVDGFHIHLLGERLGRSLDLLSKACSIIADHNLENAAPALPLIV